MKNNFAKNLKEIRESTGQSQKRLAKICGLNETTISYYEKGKRSPKIDSLILLGEKLGVTLDRLIK